MKFKKRLSSEEFLKLSDKEQDEYIKWVESGELKKLQDEEYHYQQKQFYNHFQSKLQEDKS
jgi:hypothetical protein